jgi:hypothetical protein
MQIRPTLYLMAAKNGIKQDKSSYLVAFLQFCHPTSYFYKKYLTEFLLTL